MWDRAGKIYAASIFGLISFLCLSFPISAQDKKFSFSVFAGINHVSSYGDVSDYEMGVNDFPVTPSHNPGVFGVSLGYEIYKKLGVELDVRYHLSSGLTLEDPSDADHVTTDSSKHYALTGNIIYHILDSKFRPFLIIGAGVDTLTGVEDQVVTSEYGYEIIFLPPEKKADFVFNGGGGLMFNMSPEIGIRLDIRYIYIPKSEETPAIKSVGFTAGLIFHF